jgi:hypothetical protein
MRKPAPLGIKLLSYVYLVNVLLYSLSILLFANRILVFGSLANPFLAWCVRILFLLLPLYLAYDLRRLKKAAWITAIAFHVFLIANGITIFLECANKVPSLLRITGVFEPAFYTPSQIIVLWLNSVINVMILGYLYEERERFLNLKEKK